LKERVFERSQLRTARQRKSDRENHSAQGEKHLASPAERYDALVAVLEDEEDSDGIAELDRPKMRASAGVCGIPEP
jgi:hypothetical protein